MDKRKLIFTSLIVLALVVAALSISYALNIAVTEGTSSEYDLSYTFDISDNATWTINVPAGKTKVYDISVTNPYSDTIKYGIVYKLDNPTTMPSDSLVGVLNTTENPSQGSINANSTLEISVAIVNNSSSNMQVTLGIVNGYKNGGDLIIPSGYALITRNVSLPYDIPSETLMGDEENYNGEDSPFLGSSIARKDIESLEFIKKSEVPTGASTPIDVSYDKVNYPNQVQLYSVLNSSTSKYKVYIATESGKVSLSSGNSLFADLINVTALDLSMVYTNDVTDMSYMFRFCTKLATIDISNFDTSKVTNMMYMFGNSILLKDIDISNFDTSNVTDMKQMFYCCLALTYLDLSNFKTSKVTDMSYMFDNCCALVQLSLSNFDTSNVTDMSYMFRGCNLLEELDLSSFNTSKVKSMENMFSMNDDNAMLSTIYVSDLFVTSSLQNNDVMFDLCVNLVGGNGTIYSEPASEDDLTTVSSTYARIDSSSTPGYFTNISAKPPEPNSPDLADGLIPVVYNSSTSKWVKADSANNGKSWYNYKSKRWANAVLVTDTNRNTYQSASVGTEISDSDILAFYVWIPRYKYKVWNINKVVGTDSYNAQTTGIDIVFESEKSSTGTISCTYSYAASSGSAGSPNETCTGSNEKYYTHPAFTFGSDNLRGFWTGKFELTGSNSNPTILPNVNSLRNISLGDLNTLIQNMQLSNNIYGLNTSRTDTDSHMITNMEWGAVAYLTNSKYGRCISGSCTEVTINNCSSYMTGIGADTVSASSSTTTCSSSSNKYNGTKGMLSSTTGNITGIYDMVGGAVEYVMGNTSSEAGSYRFNPSRAVISAAWYTSDTSKYLTTYAYDITNNIQQSYNRGRLGDATGEIVLSTGGSGGWYSDGAYFPYSSDYTWFARGNYYGSSSSAGIFYFGCVYGYNDSAHSTRAVLVSLK